MTLVELTGIILKEPVYGKRGWLVEVDFFPNPEMQHLFRKVHTYFCATHDARRKAPGVPEF